MSTNKSLGDYAECSRNNRSFSLDYTSVEQDDTGTLRRFTPLVNLASVLLKPRRYQLPWYNDKQKHAREENTEVPPKSALSQYRRSFPTVQYRVSMQRIEDTSEKIHRSIPLTKFALGPAPLWTISDLTDEDKKPSTSSDVSPLMVVDAPPLPDSDNRLSVGCSRDDSLMSLRSTRSAIVSTEYQIRRKGYKHMDSI